MTTKAGEALLDLLRRQRNATESQSWRNGLAYAEECVEKSLPRIEAEALVSDAGLRVIRENGDARVTATLDALAAEVGGMEHSPCVAFDYAEVIDRAAVLAIIDREDTE